MTSRRHEKTHHRRKPATAGPRRQRTDVIVYIAFVMIGVFFIPLAVLLTQLEWQYVVVGYVALLAIIVNVFAAKACFGGEVTGWQKPIARLPLRFVGYGAEMNKPLSAARHDPKARLALVLCLLISILLVGGLAYLLIR